MKKRLLIKQKLHVGWFSILLTLCIALNLMPVTSRADDTITVAQGETLTVLEAGQTAKNYGTIITNNGNVIYNYGTGTITNNNGTVNINVGSIEHNNSGATININQSGGTVTYNHYESLIKKNLGNVYGNDGTVTSNSGTIDFNRNSVDTNVMVGIINTNRGLVEHNNGTITTNDNYYGNESVTNNYGTIGDNKSTVLFNYGTVITNEVSGIVKQESDDAAVTTNSGEVYYSYPGTVSSNTSTGTEYFLVEIHYSNVYAKVSSAGLKSAYGKQWLGQGGGVQTTATVTVTPKAGYEIKAITGLPGNVTAEKNEDGTWTLTITSGQRTTIYIPEATEKTYTVRVNNGSGGGEYTRGASVTVTADEPSWENLFREWTGMKGLVFTSGSASTSTATFTMPAHDVTVTATYVPGYTLTVRNGTGSGKYAAGASVTITANNPPEGQRFKEWSGLNSSWIISGSKTTPTVTFTMPAYADYVEATYEDIPATYAVTVSNGTGSGEYAAGESVTITADAAPEGQRFKGWTGAYGLAFTSGSAAAAAATFTMPANAVEVTATYGGYDVYLYATDDVGAVVTGAGEYEEGAVVTLEAQPSAGHYFIRWDVNTGGVTVTDGRFIMPANDVIIVGRFGLLYEIAVAVSPEECGAVTAFPASAPAGTQVTLTAVPNSGYHFKEWRIAPDSVDIADNAFVMPAEAVTVTAVFVGETPYRIKTDGNAVASVFDGWTGSVVTQAVHGEELSLQLSENAVPQAGCYFTGEFELDEVSLGRVYDENHVYSWPVTDFTMPGHNVSIAAVQAQRETMMLDFTQGSALTVDYMAWQQLQSHEALVMIPDENWNEFIDLDSSGTPDLAVTAPDGVKTSDYMLTLLPDADAVGSFVYTFAGIEDRFSRIVVMITGPAFGSATFTLPASLTAVEASAFEGDTLITVVDAHNCTSIGANAFRDCTGLTRIRLPQTCRIDGTAFSGCGTVYIFAPAGGDTQAWCEGRTGFVFVPETLN